MQYGAAMMNDQAPILLLNWTILPSKLDCTREIEIKIAARQPLTLYLLKGT